MSNIEQILRKCEDCKLKECDGCITYSDMQVIKARIKELEEENASKQKTYDDCYCEYKHYKQFDSIPKQKVKDMFKKSQTLYEKKLKEIDFKELKNISLNIFEGIKIEAERSLLRRLLQKSEDK